MTKGIIATRIGTCIREGCRYNLRCTLKNHTLKGENGCSFNSGAIAHVALAERKAHLVARN